MCCLKKYLLLLIVLLLPVVIQAQTSKDAPVFVIVHGAWGGSWAFKKTDSLLTSKGATVYRPSLTGQGERVHLASPEIGLSTHVSDVVNMILFEDLHNVVLVGHSYGGMVITGVADQLPDRIQKLIYLDAYVPNDGESVKNIRVNNWSATERMVKDGFMVPAWLKPGQIPGDVKQSVKTFTEPLVLKNKTGKALPAVYILTVEKGKKPEEDEFAHQAARARQRQWAVLQLESDHNPQWSAVEVLAEMLYQNR